MVPGWIDRLMVILALLALLALVGIPCGLVIRLSSSRHYFVHELALRMGGNGFTSVI